MSAPPPGGRPNGAPRPRGGGPLRPNRPKPSIFAPRKRQPAPGQVKGPNAAKGNAQIQQKTIEQRRRENGGWSEPAPEGAKDIPIMTTKKALLDGLRLHMMKLSTPKLDGKPIDPTDDDEFARPVTLQRRDPRQPAAAREIKVEEPERPPMDEQEAERLEKIKAEKEAQKAIDQAKIAPVAKDSNPKPKKKHKEEKTQFHRTHKTEAARKEAELRYEEALPWHLEDADGKNVWVGEYIASLSGNQVAFRIDGSSFRMVPLEKFYKFTSKPAFKPLSIDEAEDFMGKKMDVGRWVMKGEEKKAEQAELEATRRLLGASGRMVKTESSTFKAASRAEKMEHDDLDVSGDEFQDDDEATTFERNNDEDEKDSKERIRREQLGANLFGEGDEKEVERELNEELKEELERRKYGKSTKKALIKRDREDVYESDDSEDNPWSSSSDDDSSEDEDEEDDESKGEGKGGQGETKDGKDSKDKDKAKSTGHKGSTPQGKKKGKGVKRAGSPAVSESSGNESTRKKKPKSSTPAVGSRAGTPSLQHAAVKRKAQTGAGPSSDAEVTVGEMSDGAGPKKKIKLKSGTGKGTPSASRAGSPNPPRGSPPPGSPTGTVTPAEILEKIPPEGIVIGDLIKFFHGRLGEGPGRMPRADWIAMVKRTCDYGPDKRLRRKNTP
ncbi:Transcription initiation factor IIF subunit alpha-like protein [Hapsidospora chrysogenum ATCC 11550]|uniref:Transcription initiation factor IIF subunit alpha-like protein n=1 Tax=Hapsidospora chrysogenum (strain ATCC 11550 / CBS 779.69 / DSM 880 / IAM 14645 / JCM 23072 / IMI 49137) TaxID=857340 RepID=A0A086SY87_HAPC1|nr:Transcription initiation factor IIF subunit alpha-like protein [Hapsidospora chrysogenum ATCC 11550]